MIKICTSIEQSEILLSLGLDPNSSDMYYTPYPNDEYWYDIPNVGMATKEVNQLSAWSLTALLKLMPSRIDDSYTKLTKLHEYGWCIEGRQKVGEPVDVAFDMVVWLIEQGLIKVNKQNYDRRSIR